MPSVAQAPGTSQTLQLVLHQQQLLMPNTVTWAMPIAPATTDPVSGLPLPNAQPIRNFKRTFYGRQPQT